MATIVLATMGSLGDMHPMIALGLELKRRGHKVRIAAMKFYREKIEMLGLEFFPMAPHLDPEDRALGRELMDAHTGTEKIIREIVMPNLRHSFADLTAAADGADVLISGEIVYAVKSVIEKTGIKWISTSLAPGTMFSTHDPFVPPMAPWMENFRFMPRVLHESFFRAAKWTVRDWYEPYRAFRRDMGLTEDHDPIFNGRFSPLLHLALFSKVLGRPQADWPPNTVQTGFCFYDGQSDTGKMPDGLTDFLETGDPPIVFTLGSAAVMDAGDFFEQSVGAAKRLKRRAVLLYGVYNQPPVGLTNEIVGYDYAPYSLVFPKAACVVHQAGVGTTGQVLRAGVPHLIVPYAHDQPDNAARCRRIGVAEIIRRDDYSAYTAARMLEKILAEASYRAAARGAAKVVATENGTHTACEAVEHVLGSNYCEYTLKSSCG